MLDEFECDGYERVPVIVTIESGEYIEAYICALNIGDSRAHASRTGLK